MKIIKNSHSLLRAGLGVLLMGLVLLTVAPTTLAQSATPAPELDETATPQPLPFQSPNPSEDQLKALRERYKLELSIYRTDERSYQIAKEQYAKLGTLVSLETVVKATQKVMQSRIAVLQTYIQMVRIALSNTPGIDVQEKANTLKEIDDIQARILQHQEVVKLAVDRLKLSQAVDDFSAFSADITHVVYKSLSYVAYGRVQTVYDKTVTVREEVRANLEMRERNGLLLGEKRRAMEEIDRRFVGTSEKMKAAQDFFLPSRGKAKPFNQGTYSQYVGTLSQIYAELLRTTEYFREVIKT